MRDQLALRVKIGDEKAFELLFRKYFVRLCGFANKFLNDPEEAREIVQDVFTKLWEVREDIEPDESLISYLFKITQNKSLNRLRHKKIESKFIEVYQLVYIDNSETSPYESLLAKELDKNISIALKKLPPGCRRIFDLSRTEGLKYSEIADELKISVKTVEAQMSKAIRILRLEIKEYYTVLIIICLALLSHHW
jgi:RNA polymerase sigma-70 factor (ECF subfamily)